MQEFCGSAFRALPMRNMVFALANYSRPHDRNGNSPISMCHNSLHHAGVGHKDLTFSRVFVQTIMPDDSQTVNCNLIPRLLL